MNAPAGGPRVRPVGPDDLEPLAALHGRCFPHDPWSRQALADLLAMPGAAGWLIESGDGPALGFLLARLAADEAEILTFGVAPERRGAGLGRRLLEAGFVRLVAAGAARLLLEVAVDNAAARRLYERCGFVEVGRRKAYLRGPDGPQDALVLALDIGL